MADSCCDVRTDTATGLNFSTNHPESAQRGDGQRLFVEALSAPGKRLDGQRPPPHGQGPFIGLGVGVLTRLAYIEVL